MNQQKRVILASMVGLALGATFMHLADHYRLTPKVAPRPEVARNPFTNPLLDDDFFRPAGSPFGHLPKIQAGIEAGDVSEREDQDFVYYDIAAEGLEPDKVKVKVEDGQLSISGRAEKKADAAGAASYFSSSFHRSFPLPPNVEADKITIDQAKDKWVVKFPKVRDSVT